MYTTRIALIATALLSILGTSCAGSKHDPGSYEALEEQILRQRDPLFVLMWGAPYSEVIDRERREYRCAWRELEQAGHDPRADFRCEARRAQYALACFREAGDDALTACEDVWIEPCSVSEAFEAALAACRPDPREVFRSGGSPPE